MLALWIAFIVIGMILSFIVGHQWNTNRSSSDWPFIRAFAILFALLFTGGGVRKVVENFQGEPAQQDVLKQNWTYKVLWSDQHRKQVILMDPNHKTRLVGEITTKLCPGVYYTYMGDSKWNSINADDKPTCE